LEAIMERGFLIAGVSLFVDGGASIAKAGV
jgi:hypothetical protein